MQQGNIPLLVIIIDQAQPADRIFPLGILRQADDQDIPLEEQGRWPQIGIIVISRCRERYQHHEHQCQYVEPDHAVIDAPDDMVFAVM